MDLFVREADVDNSRFNLSLGKLDLAAGAAMPRNLASVLRRIVFVCEPALGRRLDLQRVRLGAVNGRVGE